MRSHKGAHTKKKWFRRILLLIGVMFLAAAALAPRAAHWAALERLRAHAAGPVQLGSVWLDREGSVRLSDVRIVRGRVTLASVEKVTLHGTTAMLFSADAVPRAVILEKVELRCVLAEEGGWRFVLPFKPPARRRAPRIELRQVTFVLPNGDRFHSDRLVLAPATDPAVFEISGTVRTPAQEEVRIRGRLNRFTTAAWFELSCDQLDLSLPWLKRAEPIAHRLQEQPWRGRGYAAARLRLVHPPNQPFTTAWSYECTLDLTNASLGLAGQDIAATNLTGRLLLNRDRIELKELSGSLGHGALRLNGTIGQQTELVVSVRGVRVDDLFDLSGNPAGRFGTARLDGSLTIRGGKSPETWTGRVVTRVEGRAVPGGAIELEARIDRGHVAVERASWNWGGGRLTLTASGSLARDVLEIHLTVHSVRLDALLEAAELPGELNALVQAQLHLRGPLTRWNDPRAWALHGAVQLENVETTDRVLGTVTAGLAKGPDDSDLVIHDVTAEMLGIPLVGSASVSLTDRSWEAQLRTPRAISLALLLQLCPPDITLPDVRGRCRLIITAIGRAFRQEHEVTIAVRDGVLSWNGHELAGLGGRIQLQPGRPISFATDRFALASGQAAVRGNLRFADQARQLDIRVTLEEVEAVELVELLLGRRPETTLAGRISGAAQLSWDCRPGSYPSCGLTLSSEELQLDKLILRDLTAIVELANGRVSVPRWQARLNRFGPAVGQLRWPAGDDQSKLAIDSLTLTAIDMAAITPDRQGRPLCVGTASAELAGHLELDSKRLVLNGTARSRWLRWRGLPPAEHASAQVFIDGKQFRLRQLRAITCSGNITLDIDHMLDRSASSEISVRVQDVSLNQLLSVRRPLDPTFLSGILNGQGTITVKHDADRSVPLGYGEFSLSRARLARVPVRHGKGVVYFDGRSYDVVFDQIAVGNGTADGTVTLTPGEPTRYRVSLAFRDMSLPFLCTSVLRLRDPVAGFVTGSIELEGTTGGWHTANGAIYVTQLRDAELWKLPLFYALAEFLLPGVARPGVFHYGKGKIGVRNGVFVLDGFALRGAAAQIYIRKGRIWPDGRLDLEIIGNAETLLPPQAPVVGVIRRLADNVQHRLVKFYVTGTVQNPHVRAVPLADVSGPALQFFRDLMSGRFLPNPPPPPRR